MPRYARRPYVRRRRPFARKKYGKKYGRSRFTKKRFAKNSRNQLTMRAPLASRMLRVKLPWVKTFGGAVPLSGFQSFLFQGNGIVPYTSLGQTSITPSDSNRPSTGDSLPAGEQEYSQFYDKYFVNGSSIKIELVNISSVSSLNQVFRCVLLAMPYATHLPTNPGGNDDWMSVRDQLNGYTYEQLLAWPYAKWRMVGTNTGGSSRMLVKMFRKTKNMCGLKDLRDNQNYGSNLSDGTISAAYNPDNGFMYYFRIFNSSASSAVGYEMTVRMSLYCTLTNREFNPIQTITI